MAPKTKTKRVRMLKSLAGPTRSFRPGQEYDLEAPLADAFCSDGRAEPVEPEAPTRADATGLEGASAGPAGGAEVRAWGAGADLPTGG